MSTVINDRNDVTSHVPGHIDQLDGIDVLDALDHVDPDHEHHASDIASRVWRFLISMRTGLWIMLALGILTLFGTVLMQADSATRSDPQAYAQWLAQGAKPKYGGWTGVLDRIGFFHIFSTWYFLGLFALLSLSILACSINRAPRLWRIATRPRTSMSEVFFTHAPLRTTLTLPGDVTAATEKVRTQLRQARFRVLDGQSADGSDLYGDRFRWGPFGTVVAHLSFLVIMAGFAVSSMTGFKISSFYAPIGVPVAVGHGTGLTLRANSFQDTYYASGQPKDYVADLTLLKDGKQVARHETRVNSPLRYNGVWFHQASFGIGADISATAGGTPIFSQNVPLQFSSTDGKQVIGQFTIPSQRLEVFAIEAASGQVLPELPAGSVQLEVHKNGAQTPVGVEVLTPGRPVTIAGVAFTYERNREYTLLSVSKDNGAWLVWLGSALLVLGSYLVFFLPHRRIWVRVRPAADGTSRVLLAAPLKRDPGMEPKFAELVSAIQSSGK